MFLAFLNTRDTSPNHALVTVGFGSNRNHRRPPPPPWLVSLTHAIKIHGKRDYRAHLSPSVSATTGTTAASPISFPGTWNRNNYATPPPIAFPDTRHQINMQNRTMCRTHLQPSVPVRPGTIPRRRPPLLVRDRQKHDLHSRRHHKHVLHRLLKNAFLGRDQGYSHDHLLSQGGRHSRDGDGGCVGVAAVRREGHCLYTYQCITHNISLRKKVSPGRSEIVMSSGCSAPDKQKTPPRPRRGGGVA